MKTFAPCTHDLYESLITWERSPAKKINDLLSAEWEALTFGHRQGDHRHQIRSLENRSLLEFPGGKFILVYFSIISEGQYQECYQHLQTLTRIATVQHIIEETWDEGQGKKQIFHLLFIVCSLQLN